jgi:RNA-directed DNA polymerase
MSIELTASKDELAAAFLKLESRKDIADLLEVPERQLNYYLYVLPESRRYKKFEIPKKHGGTREIYAPANALKIVQKKLNQVLQSIYKAKPSAHGFLPQKSIVSNAHPHAKKRYILNVDFGRVRGLFMGIPYGRNHEVATTLAQICCFNSLNHLPQGAPTSPIVSNMICAKMDSQLQKLAKEHRATYTRYADDITFSSSRSKFPTTLAYFSDETGKLEVGEQLKTIINDNGFEINNRKVRLQTPIKRQEVTGLTVNLFPNVRREYVREIRGMLHAWETYGLEAAETKYRTHYAGKHPESKRDKVSFKRVVQGKINFLKMVKGEDHRVYLNLAKWFGRLAPEFAKVESPTMPSLPIPVIYTEGKTDWKHLKIAFAQLKSKGLFLDLDIKLWEYGDETQMGDGELFKMCGAFCKRENEKPNIFIFDRDKSQIVNDVMEKDKPYKAWGNNVFSFAIPIPTHRVDTKDVCIELYYPDKDIKRKDGEGRRLFLSDEFDTKTFKHKSLNDIYTHNSKIRRPIGVTVIDSQVLNYVTEESIALSKDHFAELVMNQAANFQDVEFSEFSKIFEVITMILRVSTS